MTLRSAHDQKLQTALTILGELSDSARALVLERMDPELREQLESHLAEGQRPHARFAKDIAFRNQQIAEAAERIQAARLRKVEDAIDADDVIRTGDTPMNAGAAAGPSTLELLDPLNELRRVHPAALARAMQGERAEAWAIVLDRVDPGTRTALERYLDAGALRTIRQAANRQRELRDRSPNIVASIEQAIARTVVPLALREHQQLITPSHGAPHGTAV
jgi:hypothetical protein